MAEPLLCNGHFWVDPELLRVDQAHSEDVSELVGHELLLFFCAQATISALTGRGEVGLGEFTDLFCEFEESPVGRTVDPVHLGVLDRQVLDSEGDVVEVHLDDATHPDRTRAPPGPP